MSIEWYHFQCAWVTSDPDFKVETFLKSNIWKTVCVKRQTYYCMIETLPNITEWYYVWWLWLTSKCIAQVCQHQLSFLFLQILVFPHLRNYNTLSYLLDSYILHLTAMSTWKKCLLLISSGVLDVSCYRMHSNFKIIHSMYSCSEAKC